MVYSGPIQNEKTKHDSTGKLWNKLIIFPSACCLVFCWSVVFLHAGTASHDMVWPEGIRTAVIPVNVMRKEPLKILPAVLTMKISSQPAGFVQPVHREKIINPGESVVDEQIRNHWVQQTLTYLADPSNTNEFKRMEWKETHQEGNYQKSTRLVQNGILYFQDGSYLKMIAHSAHENPEIGDITLAMDSGGRMYVNTGHVCGGIIHFITHKKLSNCRIRHFVKHFVSDTDDQRWKKISIQESVIRNQPY